MNNTKKYLTTIILASFLYNTPFIYCGQYYDPDYNGAFVAPYFKENNNTFIILGRERSGKAKGTWTFFGGGIQREDNRNPIITGAREFFEESLIGKTNNISIESITKYLEQLYRDNNNKDKKEPLRWGTLIVFPIQLTPHDAQQLINQFQPSLKTLWEQRNAADKITPHGGRHLIKYLEMDAIGLLNKADIKNNFPAQNNVIRAHVYNKDNTIETIIIPLRPPFTEPLLKDLETFINNNDLPTLKTISGKL